MCIRHLMPHLTCYKLIVADCYLCLVVVLISNISLVFYETKFWIKWHAGMVTSKVGKRHALSAFEALKELFILRSAPFLSVWLVQFKIWSPWWTFSLIVKWQSVAISCLDNWFWLFLLELLPPVSYVTINKKFVFNYWPCIICIQKGIYLPQCSFSISVASCHI